MGTEDRVMGSLAAWGIADGDWASVWEAVLVDLLPGVAAWRNPAGGAPPLAAGSDAVRTRGDIARHCGAALDPVDVQVAGPRTVDDKPGD